LGLLVVISRWRFLPLAQIIKQGWDTTTWAELATLVVILMKCGGSPFSGWGSPGYGIKDETIRWWRNKPKPVASVGIFFCNPL
jgi:hypothetical protein